MLAHPFLRFHILQAFWLEGIYLGKIEYAITFKITWFNFKNVF